MRISTEVNSPSAIQLQETVTKNVRMIIAAQSVSQADIAIALGVAQSGLSRKLNRKTDWTASDIANLATFFNLSFAEMVTPLGLFSVQNKEKHQLAESYRELSAPAGIRYLRKPDAADERGQANGPRMFMMPDLEVSGYMEKALRHSPQSRLGMGSPTWTRAELVFWLIIMYVLFLRMQYGSCFDPVDPFRENGFLLIGQADEQTEEQDGIEGDRRV